MSSSSSFKEDVEDFWMPFNGRVDRLSEMPQNEFEFYRKYVSKSVPVVIQHGIDHWPAMSRWKDPAFWQSSILNNDSKISIEWTPNGRADSVVKSEGEEALFMTPETRQDMSIASFFSYLERKDYSTLGVPYISNQNDSMRREFPSLESDYDSSLEFADRLFANSPEAINLWIGNEESVSSMHKDHYENMYCVITGQKVFYLLPPIAIKFLKEETVRTASFISSLQYCAEEKNYENVFPSKLYPSWYVGVEVDGSTTPWITSDIENDDDMLIKPIKVVVNPGEILYLPAMWYHQVTQTKTTIAVNYWYDMEFDCRYVYYNAIKAAAS